MSNKDFAYITQIAPLSSHDGPGMRTTIFFKGCTLRCKWCHNPETFNFSQELFWENRLCIGCGQCESICSESAISLSNISTTGYLIEKNRCSLCGECVKQCPSNALTFAEKAYLKDELLALILKDESLLKSLNGGVTFSGGEPALHSEFLEPIIKELRRNSIHIALDTCGEVPFSNYLQLLPSVDLILYDIKDIRPEKHKEFTGKDNSRILSNLLEMKKYIIENSLGTKIWIRTPLVPEMTADEINVSGIGEFIFENLLDVVERWELCSFNNMCVSKYNKLGMQWELENTPLMHLEMMEKYTKIAKGVLGEKIIVKAIGLTKR